MLMECLTSIAMQETDFAVAVIVSDNQSDGGNQSIVESCAETFPFPLQYVHEPRRGISNARNAAFSKAINLGADWIAVIDDDETADPHWLSSLIARAEECGADMVGGPVARRYPANYPINLPRLPWRRAPQSPDAGPASTANALISVRSLSALGVELRFDPSLESGEDREFFGRAYAAGALGAWSNNAVVTETAVVSRYGIKGCIRRGYNSGKRRFAEKGAKSLISAALRMIGGPIKIALSPLAIVAGPRAFSTVSYAGFRTMASGAGAFAGFFGARSNFYHKIDGF
jgi:succinoglycan biosynthesis protein ExoM